jgi:hypothetical protein
MSHTALPSLAYERSGPTVLDFMPLIYVVRLKVEEDLVDNVVGSAVRKYEYREYVLIYVLVIEYEYEYKQAVLGDCPRRVRYPYVLFWYSSGLSVAQR